MYWMLPALSAHGEVFGMATIEVKPPAAAAMVPVRMVSASVLPGWRRCTCMSMRPGATTRPCRLTVSVSSSEGSKEPGSTMRPSLIQRSPVRSMWLAGSMMRPFLRIQEFFLFI